MESSLRATIAGLFVGSLILLANFQFGLQTGWVSMMSLPAALLSFAIIKSIPSTVPFTPQENVYAQSVAVAVATGPLAFGFIGIIPAIEKLMTSEESGFDANWQPFIPYWKLIVWSLGMAFFGVFFAVPLRKEFIVRQKLKFPSGKATAILIGVFHHSPVYHNDDDNDDTNNNTVTNNNNKSIDVAVANSNILATSPITNNNPDEPNASEETDQLISSAENEPVAKSIKTAEQGDNKSKIYTRNIKLLLNTTFVASVYTLLSYFIPQIKTIPIFGSGLSRNYELNFTPSPAYIGQGIIMGIETTVGMLMGMILGWCILGPIAKAKGWAPGAVDDWKKGIAGWTMWVALGIMIVDSLISLGALAVKAIYLGCKNYKLRSSVKDSEEDIMLVSQDQAENSSYHSINSSNEDNGYATNNKEAEPLNVPNWIPVLGLIASTPLLLMSMHALFGSIVPPFILLLMIPLSLVLSLLGVKALGETDLNPVSGIGKLSQLVTALVLPRNSPGAILTNLVCGALAEAATQQAGDLMQDLKTGYMHKSSPRAQFVAQLVGSVWSVLLSTPIWIWYNKVYQIPGNTFKIPTAVIWIDCARLINGQGLPPMAGTVTLIASIITASISLLKIYMADYVERERESLQKENKSKGNLSTIEFANKKASIDKVAKWIKWIPSGVTIGIGIYNASSFTLARFVGGLISVLWTRYHSSSDHINLIIFSSGLVLGEGITSVVNMALSTWGVSHL